MLASVRRYGWIVAIALIVVGVGAYVATPQPASKAHSMLAPGEPLRQTTSMVSAQIAETLLVTGGGDALVFLCVEVGLVGGYPDQPFAAFEMHFVKDANLNEVFVYRWSVLANAPATSWLATRAASDGSYQALSLDRALTVDDVIDKLLELPEGQGLIEGVTLCLQSSGEQQRWVVTLDDGRQQRSVVLDASTGAPVEQAAP